MKLFETKKDINEEHNTEKYGLNEGRRSVHRHEHSKKAYFLDKSDYGWDGDY